MPRNERIALGGLIIALVVGGFAVLKATGPGVVLWLIATVFWAVAVVLLVTLGRDWRNRRRPQPPPGPLGAPRPTEAPKPPTGPSPNITMRGVRSWGNEGPGIRLGRGAVADMENVETFDNTGGGIVRDDDPPEPLEKPPP